MNWYENINEQEVDYPNISRIVELSRKIDQAYKDKNFQNIEEMEQELESLIEKASDTQEEKLVEGGGEVEGYDIEGDGFDKFETPSLEELLANGYREYINFEKNKFGPFFDKQNIIDNMRASLMYGGIAKSNVSDQMILDAAKDAYDRRLKLIEQHKKFKRSKNMNWYKAAQIQNKIDSEDLMVDMASDRKSIPSNIKRVLNHEIHAIGNYHSQIPLDKIKEILKTNSVIMVQEDGTPWSGFLMGKAECGTEDAKKQYADIDLAFKKDNNYILSNNTLHVSWCLMPSGRYEVVCYIS